MNSISVQEYEELSKLDNNQKYDVIRKAVIFYFAKNSNNLECFGLDVVDFPAVMKFVKTLYFNYEKRKDIIK